ncbi:MAG TPA: cytochrome b/b6 domain-containing protein [Rhizomicrobium sp.]|jgi:thiosulfate reductase cytochrome b subunit|nr:cytochrome b/b6 domain-containing protein [Rhizomicrobium sp.]
MSSTDAAHAPATRIPPWLRRALGLSPEGPHYFFRRHSPVARATHWVNAVILYVMLLSGLQIFNAHPALYWGASSNFEHPVLSLTARGYDETVTEGVTQIGSLSFDTTGVLGASKVDGVMTARGFPDWATIPGPQWLAMGRLWHFFFAWLFVLNGAVFIAWAYWSGHARRDLWPTLRDAKHLPREIADHALLRFPKGEAARRYNGLQKMAYSFILFVVAPVIILTGLSMSPTMDAAFPWLPWIFGGRQSARTIHFLCAFAFLGFFVVHIVMVILSGAWNNLRSMVTGRYAIEGEDHG